MLDHFSDALFVLYTMIRMEVGFPPARICTVLPADAVTTGEVNCYILFSSARFCEDGPTK